MRKKVWSKRLDNWEDSRGGAPKASQWDPGYVARRSGPVKRMTPQQIADWRADVRSREAAGIEMERKKLARMELSLKQSD